MKMALLKLLALTPVELQAFKPNSIAEAMALKQVQRALGFNDASFKVAITAT
jgi:hypothetical protein